MAAREAESDSDSLLRASLESSDIEEVLGVLLELELEVLEAKDRRSGLSRRGDGDLARSMEGVVENRGVKT